MRVVLGVTGSVAATIGEGLVKPFAGAGDEVKVIATQSALKFALDPAPAVWEVLTDADEWAPCGRPWGKGDPILHIVLRDWMDVLVIAPLSANTLGKMANGICDNLLLSVWLAAGGKPVVVAPAMNTQMWFHPAVRKNVRTVATMGVTVVDPVSKTLACGETGLGAMAPMDSVALVAREMVGRCAR